MTPRRRTGYLLSMALIAIGACGILFSPSIGVRGGTEQRQFTSREAIQTELMTTIVVSTIDLPYVQNGKGLAFMHGFVFLSMATLFSGVHLFSLLQRRILCPV